VLSSDETASVRESTTAPMRLLMILLISTAPAAAVPARAAPQATVELKWAAPVGCPTEAAIRHELGRRLSGIPPLERPIVADAEIRQVSAGFALEVHLYNETVDEPVRRYQRASCQDLGDMAVDEISSAFPTLRARADKPAPSPVPAPPAPVAPEKPLKVAHPPRTVAGAVRLGGIVGSQERAVLGGPTVSLGLLGPRWRLEVAALYLKLDELSYTITPAVAPDVRVAWQVAAGQLTACGAAVARDRLELHLCGGGEIGGVLGKSANAAQLDDSGGSSRLWLAVHAGAMVSVRLHRNVYLWASATPVLAFPGAVNINIETADGERAPHDVDLGSPWFQLRGALGMEIRWGRSYN